MKAFRGPSQVVAPTGLAERVAALSKAADLAAGRSPEPGVAEAKRVAKQVPKRLGLTGEATVIALAGPTGSGKSSLFNGIAGSQLARPGVRRPTTDAPEAACWNVEAPALMNWLRVDQRHDVPAGDPRFDGLVLLDMPDLDSVDASHRDEADRLLKLVDGIIWVLDPQKYADHGVHDAYLRRLAPYSDVMLVVLNQSDRLSADDLARAGADLRALLGDDGLPQVAVLTTSALTGQGIDELRHRIAEKVVSKKLATGRLATDVAQAARELLGDVSRQRHRAVSAEATSALLGALDQAAGVPEAVAQVTAAVARNGRSATGWPLISWINRLHPDPPRRLRGLEGAVAMARVDAALRDLSANASAGLAPGWADAVEAAATRGRDKLPEQLNDALATLDLGQDVPMAWWKVVRLAQLVLLGVAGIGVVWAVIAGLVGWTVPGRPTVTATLIVGGLLLGGAVAVLGRLAVGLSARHRGAQVAARLRTEVAKVADQVVLQPVSDELTRYSEFVGAVARAL